MAPRSPAVTALATISALGLSLIAACHAIWTVTPWPLASWDRFGRVVLGTPDGRVPAELVVASPVVAVLLFGATYLTLARSGQVRVVGPRWAHRFGLWLVAGVLLARATLGGFAPSALGWVESSPEYLRWDLTIYSPLCLVLGIATAVLARRPPP